MHPTIQYEITKAQIADQRRRAAQDAIAHAARRGHRALIVPRRYPAPGWRAAWSPCWPPAAA